MQARTIKRTESRKRGVIGWFFLLLFWGYNALMAYAVVAGIGATVDQGAGLTGAAKQGHDIGIGLGFMVMLMFWAFGAVVFGAMAYFTRGKLVVTEQIME